MKLPLSHRFDVTQDLIPLSRYHRPGRRIQQVRFLVAHDTDNTERAPNEIRNLKRANNTTYASAHLFVDDRNIIEAVPFLTMENSEAEQAVHVRTTPQHDNRIFGVEARDAAGGFELCFGTRTNPHNINRTEAYKKYVWTLAYACHKYRLNPRTDIIAHSTLDPTRRRDPEGALALINKTFTDLVQDVAQEYFWGFR